MTKEILKKWRNVTDELAEVFTNKYFPDLVYNDDTQWVYDEVGGILEVNDMFFNIDRIITALEYNATYNQLYDYYHQELDYLSNGDNQPFPINFKNYIRYIAK